MKRLVELLTASAVLLIVAGVFLNWGPGWALVVLGVLLAVWALMFFFEVPNATDRQTRGT